MTSKITMSDLDSPSVGTVRRIKKVAPCGSCGEEVDRDSMWAMNTLLASPEDGHKVRIRVRLCPACVDLEMADLKNMEWDNAKMRVVE